MSVRLPCAILALASGVVLASPGMTAAQWYPSANPCACALPVTQTCFQTVPVTEYRQVRQTVKRPIIETAYVDQPITEYRQVVEPKTVDVQTVQYQDVTECRTLQCNSGYWATRYHCIPRVTPCEYDNRPDLLGFLNRTGYTLRMALTPTMIAAREYVPQTTMQTIPVTRRIAIPTTRQVTYNVTRLVPQTSTRKVAINTVRYVDEEVISLQPTTVLRTVQVGTRMGFTYAPFIAGATQTALRPSPDPISSADANKTSPKRTADSHDKFDSGDAFRPSEAKQPSPEKPTPAPATKSSFNEPLRGSSGEPVLFDQQRAELHDSPTPRSVPSIVRVSGWRARQQSVIDTTPVVAVAKTTP